MNITLANYQPSLSPVEFFEHMLTPDDCSEQLQRGLLTTLNSWNQTSLNLMMKPYSKCEHNEKEIKYRLRISNTNTNNDF